MSGNKDDIHRTFSLSTCHASIVCGCGKKVWYGCGDGIDPKTKPKYCSDCEQKILKRVHPPKAQTRLPTD